MKTFKWKTKVYTVKQICFYCHTFLEVSKDNIALNSRKRATKEISETLNVLLSTKIVVIGNCKGVSSENVLTVGFTKNQEFRIYKHFSCNMK